MTKRRGVSVVACVMGPLLALAVGCRQYPSALDWARSQIPTGTPRQDAIALLGATAWYHQPCWDRTDLFFYGSRSYDRAEIVILSSKLVNGVYVVDSIGGFEPNAWHAAYADCIKRERFED
jgi:hypothetical protein